MSFTQGVSGLNAAASNLDVIGNNIANSGTVGYKAGSAQFANVYAGSMAGLGTKVSGVFQDFTAGAIQRSNRPLDMAIVDGNGFFRMTNDSGEVRYTRNGQFNVDKDQFIVNASGMQLTGYVAGAEGSLAALKVEPTFVEPAATTKIEAQFNIDARSEV
ncbi:MAG: flagellar hook protein FlgE, partial [Comamonadaceae bacterium CG_4_10_14_3_um_filter_60_42]